MNIKSSDSGARGRRATEQTVLCNPSRTKYTQHECDFVAFTNIGLPEAGMLGGRKKKHMARLRTMTKEFLTDHHVLGICFVECGNAGAGYGRTARQRFESCVKAGFEEAGATEHGAPIFLWPSLSEEVVSVFRAGVRVGQLPLLPESASGS